jgi:hypothetical protein
MKTVCRSFRIGMLAVAIVACGSTALAQQNRRYENVRDTVQRAQDDLIQVRGQGTRSDKERERLDNARKHLSDFDRNLSKNRFDKGRLDSAIDDVKNVVENNTLEAHDRDALSTDLADLRRIRAMHGE